MMHFGIELGVHWVARGAANRSFRADITPEQRAKAVEEYLSGVRHPRLIAEDLGVSRQTIINWSGGRPSPKAVATKRLDISQAERDKAVARVLAGESRKAVGKSVGVSDRTIGTWVRDAAVPNSAQSHAPRPDISPERREEIVQLVLNGMTYDQAAEQAGVTSSTVARWLGDRKPGHRNRAKQQAAAGTSFTPPGMPLPTVADAPRYSSLPPIQPKAAWRFCASCGNPNKPTKGRTWRYCPRCGEPME
jgi:transposase-like protein